MLQTIEKELDNNSNHSNNNNTKGEAKKGKTEETEEANEEGKEEKEDDESRWKGISTGDTAFMYDTDDETVQFMTPMIEAVCPCTSTHPIAQTHILQQLQAQGLSIEDLFDVLRGKAVMWNANGDEEEWHDYDYEYVLSYTVNIGVSMLINCC